MSNEHKEITGNIGEWSEIYTLLKLLGEGKVYAGDQNLEKIKNLVYPIIMIIRQEKEGVYDYLVSNADIVIQKADGTELLRLSAEKFLKPNIFFRLCRINLPVHVLSLLQKHGYLWIRFTAQPLKQALRTKPIFTSFYTTKELA